MEIFLVLLIVAGGMALLLLRGKVEDLEHRLNQALRQSANLSQRLEQLEHQSAAPGNPPAPVAQPPSEAPQRAGPEPVFDSTPPVTRPEREPLSVPAAPTFGDRIRGVLGDQEWEALVGGSLLNKMGALVLVVGIALFLGYSFTHMTPRGRALTSLGVSLSMLAGGVLLRSRKTYSVFAAGFIGGGWAALYVTTYALYAMPAARLIDNPFTGSLLLLLVATGMIWHSLRYRIQALTAVAYFSAFAALALTPSSTFAVVSLIPLAVSLLYLAQRFEWDAMALSGAIATYLTCVARSKTGVPLAAAEATLLIYWLLFEAFDILRTQRRNASYWLAILFPVNAAGFLALSYTAWLAQAPDRIWSMSAIAAALYLASAIVRFRLRPPASFPTEVRLPERMRAGSFELPVSASACLVGLAIAGRLTGTGQSSGFAVEAELLYLTGVFMELPFLRWLGGVGFAVSLSRLTYDLSTANERFGGRPDSMHVCTPALFFQSALFYINRIVRKPNVIYSSLAAALIALGLGVELPTRFIGPVWLVMAALLFELGFRKNLREFRFQAYVLATAGAALTMLGPLIDSAAHPWIPLACALVLVYALVLRDKFSTTDPLAAGERRWLNTSAAAAISTFSILLVQRTVPFGARGLVLALAGAALFELGLRNLPRAMRNFSYAVAACAALLAVVEQSSVAAITTTLPLWISCAGVAAAGFWFAERSTDQREIEWAASTVAAIFSLRGLWLLLPYAALPIGWASIAFALFLIGLRRAVAHYRWQSYLIAIASAFQAWIAVAEFRAPHALFSGVLAVACCYVLEFSSPRTGVGIPAGPLAIVDRQPRIFWSLLATTLATALVGHQFAGGLLTTAWGVEALALLGAGFPLRERVLRLQGLAMLLLCILKLFLYDLRNLETVYRILSFVALGIMLLGVSWIYTRFKARVREYL